MALWRESGFTSDAFTSLSDADALPEGPIVVSLKRFLSEREELLARNSAVGVLLQPSDRLEAIEGDLGRISLLALAFPKFGDGRAFSLARLARERYGYAGELRAVGDILFDRIGYMLRCGFDALDISNEPTIAELRSGRIPLPQEAYQPTGQDGADPVNPLRPWRRLA
jgi:uncharacterized protein (DUF934 family)